MNDITSILLGLGAGTAFGFVIQRTGATDPHKMARSHLMIDGDIPRFMVAATALSILGLWGLLSRGIGQTSVLPTSIVATGVAGIVFGIGWGLTGYCPGTSWAAAGEGRLDAIFALLGGFAGTAVFAQFHEHLIPLLYAPTNVGRIALVDWFGGNRPVATLVLAAAMGAGAWMIGRFWGEQHAV